VYVKERQGETRNSGRDSKSQWLRWSLRVRKQETRKDIEGNVFHWFKKKSAKRIVLPRFTSHSHTCGVPPPSPTPTWTRPDYLVNRELTKYEGSKFLRKSRNSCVVNSRGVGAHGQLTRGSNGLSPETNTNAQRILPLGTKLLELPAQFLIGSPRTLIALQTPRTSRLSTFYYCQVVNGALLRLLSTYILV